LKIVFSPSGEESEIRGVRRVHALLDRLEILPGTVLVIRGDALLTEDEVLSEEDSIEIRSVVSGG